MSKLPASSISFKFSRNSLLRLSPLIIFLLLLHFLSSNSVMGKKRLCGKMLTQELRRICTKPGTKSPCLHGQFNPPSKRSSTPISAIMPWHRFSTDLWMQGRINRAFSRNFFGLPPAFHDSPIRPSTFPNFLDARRKRSGIAEKCCSGAGCDDNFLDTFCCDEDEQKAFSALNT